MRIHWCIPLFRELLQAADVIEMPVREDNCRRSGSLPEAFRRSAFDASCHPPDPSVDQDPLPIAAPRPPVEHHIHQCQTPVSEVGRNFSSTVIWMRKIRDCFGREWDLLSHRLLAFRQHRHSRVLYCNGPRAQSEASLTNLGGTSAGLRNLSRPMRAIPTAQLHAVASEALLDFGYMRAISSFNGAKDMDAGKVRAGERAIVDDLRDVRSSLGKD